MPPNHTETSVMVSSAMSADQAPLSAKSRSNKTTQKKVGGRGRNVLRRENQSFFWKVPVIKRRKSRSWKMENEYLSVLKVSVAFPVQLSGSRPIIYCKIKLEFSVCSSKRIFFFFFFETKKNLNIRVLR